MSETKEGNKMAMIALIGIALLILIAWLMNQCSSLQKPAIDMAEFMEYYTLPEIGSYNDSIDGDSIEATIELK
jgi:hypothetical protein